MQPLTNLSANPDFADFSDSGGQGGRQLRETCHDRYSPTFITTRC
jgi:hypothetical protein